MSDEWSKETGKVDFSDVEEEIRNIKPFFSSEELEKEFKRATDAAIRFCVAKMCPMILYHVWMNSVHGGE